MANWWKRSGTPPQAPAATVVVVLEGAPGPSVDPKAGPPSAGPPAPSTPKGAPAEHGVEVDGGHRVLLDGRGTPAVNLGQIDLQAPPLTPEQLQLQQRLSANATSRGPSASPTPPPLSRE